MSLKALKKKDLQALVPQFKLGKQLGAGGNGIVYAAMRGEESVAVKFLMNPDPKRYGRFRDEVLIVTTVLKGSNCALPIIEYHLPDAPGTEIPWYAMPVATPLRQHIEGAPKRDLVSALAGLADGLADLHDKKVAHRDIKPENLFFFDNSYRYGDFGIAKFPDSAGLTTATEPMGPLGYMADEMMRSSASANPFKADVLSLAKTLWVLLTNQPYPFLGQYSRRGRYCLDELLPKDRFVHEPLDDLLEVSTHTIPDMRPTPREFAQALRDVVAAQDDFELRNPLQWAGAEALAFGVPFTRIEWTSLGEIVEVVKLLCRRESLNHTFFPGGGGLDITDAELTEDGTALLLWHSKGSATIIKPVRLTLERLGVGPRGSYATLESAALEPFGVREKSEWDEELLRYDEYNYMALPCEDDPWPKDIARVSRYFKPGMFVIAPKGGIYNRIDTYQGKGNALGRDKLRAAFEGALKKDDDKRATFGLRRYVRLVEQLPSANTTFLTHLDLGAFEQLLALDEAMKKLQSVNRKTSIKSILSPNPAWVAKRKEILLFLGTLSTEQFGEAMALMQFGRREIEDADDILGMSAANAKGRLGTEYLAEKFGNDYFLKAAKRFGLTVIPTQHGV